MAKRKNNAVTDHAKAMRRANWEAKRAAMAEGRRERATTYADRRRVADRRACRDRRLWD
jgi:hypothetical protein